MGPENTCPDVVEFRCEANSVEVFTLLCLCVSDSNYPSRSGFRWILSQRKIAEGGRLFELSRNTARGRLCVSKLLATEREFHQLQLSAVEGRIERLLESMALEGLFILWQPKRGVVFRDAFQNGDSGGLTRIFLFETDPIVVSDIVSQQWQHEHGKQIPEKEHTLFEFRVSFRKKWNRKMETSGNSGSGLARS